MSEDRQGIPFDPRRQAGYPGDVNNDPMYTDPAFTSGRGSRLAKFFDNKQKDDGPLGHSPHSAAPGPRPPSGIDHFAGQGQQNLDQLFAMLNSSQRVRC